MEIRLENRFKKTLEAKRDELIREILARRERMTLELATDPMDLARNMADRDNTVRGVGRRNGLLRMVKSALDEIGDGTFGTCAHCGEEIPRKRLEAVPWSPYCVACQDLAERAENQEDGPPVDAYALAS